jgi:hypothetical protein
MDADQRYTMAFLSSEMLYEKAMAYINQEGTETLDERRALLVDVLCQFTDESLQAQFLNYLEIMDIRPMAQRAINGCVATIKKASKPLIKKLVSGMSPSELDNLGQFMQEVIVGTEGGRAYVGYPVTDEIVVNFRTVFAGVRQGQGAEHIDLFQTTLIDMTRCAYLTFFEQPIKLIKLGSVKRKLTDVALKLCKSTTLKLIESVFKGMPQKELEVVADYLESMIYERQP